MLQPRFYAGVAIDEPDRDVQHLGREIAVREPPFPEGAAPARMDVDRDAAHERLEPHGSLDRPRQRPGGPLGDRYPEVLMEHPAELMPASKRRVSRRESRGAGPRSETVMISWARHDAPEAR